MEVGNGAGDRAPTCPLRLRHPADPAELHRIREHVRRWAQRAAVPADVLDDLQLAVNEAVANGVEHAYSGAVPGVVEVDLHVRQRRNGTRVIVARVADQGRWRPVLLVNGHRGRGLVLIRKLTEQMRVSATATGTEVCFEIGLPA